MNQAMLENVETIVAVDKETYDQLRAKYYPTYFELIVIDNCCYHSVILVHITLYTVFYNMTHHPWHHLMHS